VDGKHNLITDVYVTPGNVHDANPYLARLKRQKERFGFEVEAVALDAGYLTSPICHALKEQKIFAVIAHRRFHPQKGLFHKWQFKYDVERDVYICPGKHELTYRTTNRQGYREYKSDPQTCKDCPFLSRCTRSKNHVKTITRHVWEDAKEWVRQNRLSERGKALYKRRKETIERSFADAKELHGLRYARMRGLARVTEQCLLTAVCQNIKKMALLLWKRSKGPEGGPFLRNFVRFSLFSSNLYTKPSSFSAGFVNSLKRGITPVVLREQLGIAELHHCLGNLILCWKTGLILKNLQQYCETDPCFSRFVSHQLHFLRK
jgi:hypothetical protein